MKNVALFFLLVIFAGCSFEDPSSGPCPVLIEEITSEHLAVYNRIRASLMNAGRYDVDPEESYVKAVVFTNGLSWQAT